MMATATPPRVYAIIPAAGASRRMGTPKQLLPFAKATVLETVIETVLSAKLEGLMVVTNARVDEALGITNDKRFLSAINPDADAEMIDSIILGASRLAVRHITTPRDAIIVCPGDIPGLSVGLINACANAYREHPSQVVVASRDDKAAHPIVVPFGLHGEMETLRGVGLKGVLARFSEQVRFVEAGSREDVEDIDTPEAYEQARKNITGEEPPPNPPNAKKEKKDRCDNAGE